jgi:hypothetical protein
MKPSRVHTCVFQEQVAMNKQQPNPARTCRCRKLIEYKDANDWVKWGDALWVVTKWEGGSEERVCNLCKAEGDFRSCDNCKGTGKTQVGIFWATYNGDIVLVNHRTKSNRISTPKTPTIEKGHIERFILFKGQDDKVAKEAQERIEEYGRMNQLNLQSLGAELRDLKTRELLIAGIPESENSVKSYPPGTFTFRDGSTNKSWYWIVEGRKNDFGRPV